MYFNEKILFGKNDEYDAYILPKMVNRHGIISGASGSGKTITLKVLAESFSEAGIPSIVIDVKGDLSGMCEAGTMNENISGRIEKLNLKDFNLRKFPTEFWDLYGNGIPIRTTISKLGPKLLSRMLDLTDVQEGVLTIIFKIAEDENLELVDLKDLRSMLTYVLNKRQDYSVNYGNITSQSVGAIQRGILTLEEENINSFFGKPELDIRDFIHFDSETGNGYINIIDSTTLFKYPTLYSTMLVWILNELYSIMPEVGDLPKPKLVFFIDEAHLIFSNMPNHMIKQIIQIVKLIRSKGIGLYFISQSPSDIPDEILSELGNRIQHVLRYYTKNDEKAINAAANSFRENDKFNTKEAISTLATGEALTSTQNEDGQISIVEKVTILPPQSKIGTIDDITRKNVIYNSRFYEKYKNLENIDSAFDKISNMKDDKKEIDKTKNSKSKKNSETKLEKAVDKLTNQTMSTLGRKIGNSIWKNLFK